MRIRKAIIERRGRPKKPSKVHLGKDEATQKEVMEARIIAFRQPHRQSVPEQVRHDPRAETFFGRIMLSGVISEVQYEAGILYRRAVQRSRSLMDAPNPSPQSVASYMQPVSSTGRPVDDAEAQRIHDSRENAYVALMDAGQRAAKAVARVAVWDEWPLGVSEQDLHRGLDKLIVHYGLKRGR